MVGAENDGRSDVATGAAERDLVFSDWARTLVGFCAGGDRERADAQLRRALPTVIARTYSSRRSGGGGHG